MKSELNLASRPLLNTTPLYVLLGALTLAALGLTAWNSALYLNTRSEAAAVESQLGEIEQQEKALLTRQVELTERLQRTDLDELGARVDAANMVLAEKSVSWDLLLERLQEVQPWSVRLDSIRTSLRKGVVGLSLDLRTAKPDYYWDFVEKLEAHACFSDVYPSGQNERPDGEFEVTLQLNHDPWCGEVDPNAAERQVRTKRSSRRGNRG